MELGQKAIQHKKQIEQFALGAAIIQPLITLPQIIEIFSNQSAQDVSMITWVGYLIFGLIFLIYGAVFRLRPIFFGQVIWVTMQATVIFGIVLYS